MLFVLAFCGALGVTSSFSMNYTAEGESTLSITGWEPVADGSYPVVLFLGNAILRHEFNVQMLTLTQTFFEWDGGLGKMADACGVFFAVVETPRALVQNGEVDDACELNRGRARAVFTSPGNALTQICALPRANCSKGLAVASDGTGGAVGAIGAGLPGLAYPIQALYSTQFGSELTWRGNQTRLECMTSETVSPYLPRSRRLSVISSTDGVYGRTPEEVLQIQKEMSGYDCGDDYDCIQKDGSGYFVFDTSKIGLPIVHGHWGVFTVRGQEVWSLAELFRWLWSRLPSDSAQPQKCKPGCDKSYSFPPLLEDADSAGRRPLFASTPSLTWHPPSLAPDNEWQLPPPSPATPSPPTLLVLPLAPALLTLGSPPPPMVQPHMCTEPDIPDYSIWLQSEWYYTSLGIFQGISYFL